MTATLPEAAISAAVSAVMARHAELEEAGAEVIPYEMGEFRADIVAALDAAAPAIRAAIYTQLGNDHYVIFTEDRWTIEHSVECRLSGHMHECDDHEAIARIAVEYDPRMAGRWRIDGIDSKGLPMLVRADPDGGAV